MHYFFWRCLEEKGEEGETQTQGHLVDAHPWRWSQCCAAGLSFSAESAHTARPWCSCARWHFREAKLIMHQDRQSLRTWQGVLPIRDWRPGADLGRHTESRIRTRICINTMPILITNTACLGIKIFFTKKASTPSCFFYLRSNYPDDETLCRCFRFAQLAKGKKSRP